MAERSSEHGEGGFGNRVDTAVLTVAREAIRRLLRAQGGVEDGLSRLSGIGTNRAALTVQADGRARWNCYRRASGLVVVY